MRGAREPNSDPPVTKPVDDPAFSPGFRCSAFDAAVLVLGGAAAVAVGAVHTWLGIAVGADVLHFFLFCNVVRMCRPLELVWAAGFTTLCGLAAAEVVAWPWASAGSLVLTVVVVSVEVRRAAYHGVGWRTLNPGLPDRWRAGRSGG